MEPLTYETLNRNPELIRALMEQARRERAEAVHRLIIQPIKRLFARPATRTHFAHSRKGNGIASYAP
jgi:hypothetical protein